MATTKKTKIVKAEKKAAPKKASAKNVTTKKTAKSKGKIVSSAKPNDKLAQKNIAKKTPVKKTAKQDNDFKLTATNLKKAKEHLAKYPKGKKSAVMPILDIAQRQNGGWLSTAAIEHVAEIMDMPPIRVQEVASFYEMYNTEPVGEHIVWVCRTTPCWLRGSEEVLSACKKNMGIDVGETTKDGKFTLREMECLGACVNAPILWVDDDYYEDVDAEDTNKIVDSLRKGKRPPVGSVRGRQCSAPIAQPKEAK